MYLVSSSSEPSNSLIYTIRCTAHLYKGQVCFQASTKLKYICVIALAASTAICNDFTDCIDSQCISHGMGSIIYALLKEASLSAVLWTEKLQGMFSQSQASLVWRLLTQCTVIMKALNITHLSAGPHSSQDHLPPKDIMANLGIILIQLHAHANWINNRRF